MDPPRSFTQRNKNQTIATYLPRRRPVVLQQGTERQQGPGQRRKIPQARRKKIGVVPDAALGQGEGGEAVQELPQQRGGLGADLICDWLGLVCVCFVIVCLVGVLGVGEGVCACARALLFITPT